MYEEYFGLKEKPFSIVPDPRYFFMSAGHREALAHLLYGVKNEGGFVLLTGEVGTGKTTVCKCLLKLMPADIQVAFILNPRLTVEELLATVCEEFGVNYPVGNRSVKLFVTRINNYLLGIHEKGQRAVLIVEEAQNLSEEVLEEIRLLTNLETSQRKLLQIILIGQPELREIVSQPHLRQLSQRVTARYHLGPLSRKETFSYVNYRLSVAGLLEGQLFQRSALRKLYRVSGGVPRLINAIGDRALLGAYVQGRDQVDKKTLTTAAREVSGAGAYMWRIRKIYQGIMAALLLALCMAIAGTYYYMQKPRPSAKGRIESSAREPAARVRGDGETVHQVESLQPGKRLAGDRVADAEAIMRLSSRASSGPVFRGGKGSA